MSIKEKFELWELLNPTEAEKLNEERKANTWRMIPRQFFPNDDKPDAPPIIRHNAGGMARELAAQDSESPTNVNG